MAKSKKKIKKSIESFDKLIEEHEGKIKNYPGKKDYLIPYWNKQIEDFGKEKEKLKRKLKDN
jgi:hypothetical protein